MMLTQQPWDTTLPIVVLIISSAVKLNHPRLTPFGLGVMATQLQQPRQAEWDQIGTNGKKRSVAS